jgi:ATP-dependent protease ClpP protease subunit
MSATEAKAYGIIDQIITPPDRTQAGFFEKTNNSLL